MKYRLNSNGKPDLRWYLAAMLLMLAVFFFYLGLSLPIMSTKKQLIISFGYTETTLWDSIVYFWHGKEYFLASVIFFFTIVFPIVKFIHLGASLFYPPFKKMKLFNLSHYISDKWSMLDVFIIALVIFHIKMNSQVVVTSLKPGTTFLALSIILRMLSNELGIKRIIKET
ncbi:paraquat-inducible protein A [Saccharicrinis sp. FJH2]|uniref:paraquat-inducible protein A n=1 Tax=Saccharicrinis sp. FJH65 TaxID=3344659 RepID=UPI0035F22CEA